MIKSVPAIRWLDTVSEGQELKEIPRYATDDTVTQLIDYTTLVFDLNTSFTM